MTERNHQKTALLAPKPPNAVGMPYHAKCIAAPATVSPSHSSHSAERHVSCVSLHSYCSSRFQINFLTAAPTSSSFLLLAPSSFLSSFLLELSLPSSSDFPLLLAPQALPSEFLRLSSPPFSSSFLLRAPSTFLFSLLLELSPPSSFDFPLLLSPRAFSSELL